MGRRSRKQRGAGPAERPHAVSAPAPVRARPSGRVDERPKPPWHPFPLIELCVLLGIGMLVWGFFLRDQSRGVVLIVCGLVLGSLGGLDTVVREHFAGYKSHSTLLAGFPAVILAGALYFARAPWPLVVGLAIAAFAAAFMAFRRAFRTRSGGVSFR